MSVVGIYFGPKIIRIVESKGRALIKEVQIPTSAIVSAEAEEKIPPEVKLIALFKDTLRRNNITPNEISLSLSGKDLIIRNFEMPALPREELERAVNFEAKKYIPFKIEELVSASQAQLDRASHTNLVLFTGIKKETLNKYLSVFKQLNIKVSIIEYAPFGMLRCLKLVRGLSERGIVGIVSTDIQEEDDVNFTVLENGFPLFSRDIAIGRPEQGDTVEEMGHEAVLEKLKTEIRVSLDYYYRKFSSKKIQKVFIISDQNYRSELEASLKEFGLSSQALDLAGAIGKQPVYSLSLVKAYSSSLFKTIRSRLAIDLLAAHRKAQEQKMATPEISSLLEGLRVDFRFVSLGIAICIAVFGLGLYRKQNSQKELEKVISLRPAVSIVDPNLSYEELTAKEEEYKVKLSSLDKLVKSQLYATRPLDIIPRMMPEGIWLKSMVFNSKEEGKVELTLEGTAYLSDSNKEIAAVNTFVSNLKNDRELAGYFTDISVISLEASALEKLMVTNFSIYCKTYKPKGQDGADSNY